MKTRTLRRIPPQPLIIRSAIFAICICGLTALAETVETVSPDAANTIQVTGIGEGADRLGIRFSHAGRTALELSNMNIGLEGPGELSGAAQLIDVERARQEQSFTLPWGKSSKVVARAFRATIRLRDAEGIEWEIELAAFDDAVAYRYGLTKQSKLDTFTITHESADVRFNGVPTIHYTALSKFTNDHEAEFHRDELTGVMGPLIDLPLLAVWPDGFAAGITEARVRDFPNMYLEPSLDLDSELLHTRLSPLPGNDAACVTGRTPHVSPWRVVQLGDSAGEMLESNVLLFLNDRPQAEFSWVKPGKTTWHWWNGTFEHPPGTNPGMNFESHKRYIDFCAANGIAYHAVIADMRPWHVQSGDGFSPKPDTDILTPRPELELPKIIEYARERGVGIRLWLHWKAIGDQLEEAFQRYEDWGIAGLMIDFLDRDDQEMVDFSDRVLESAARHKLHIQFHGSYKPSGEQRTFPHLFNREGVLNLEYLKWSKRCTPPHNIEAAYVRQLAGPMDYHLGGFHSISNANFVAQNENPYVLGTRCHHLAMYVVYENPMPQVCDTPEAYEGQTGFDFIVDVPTAWDETRFVTGVAGDYIVMARRKGTAWYVGGMTNWTPRKLEVPLDFLAPGTYTARVYIDGSMDQEEPNAISVETKTVNAGTTLPIEMAPGGGFAAIIASTE